MPRAALAFSGGLDTSYAVLALLRDGHDVVTVTVDTGGFTPKELIDLEERALSLGAVRHLALDGRQEVFDQFFRYVLFGNVLRGGVYPVAVGAERFVQAAQLVMAARAEDCTVLAHGCTAAGNDQVRFDVALAAMAPGMEVLAPIRDGEVSREASTAALAEAGVKIPEKTTRYSVNAGLVGTTVGGGETHDPWQEIPEEAWNEAGSTIDPTDTGTQEFTITFDQGMPAGGIDTLAELDAMARPLGIGRGVHLGDTILGIKGRIGFVAPAATLLIAAHRELEKLVLTKRQADTKNAAGKQYGDLLHEGLYLDPVCRDLECLLESSQEVVTGEVRVRLHPGRFEVLGVRSPHSLVRAGATYGEGSELWSARDAAGFAKIYGLPSRLAEERLADDAHEPEEEQEVGE